MPVKYYLFCRHDRNFGSVSPSQYLITLLQPITNIFNQLHSQDVLKTPMECKCLDFGECESTFLPSHLTLCSVAICGATFIAEDFESRRLTAPIIIYLV